MAVRKSKNFLTICLIITFWIGLEYYALGPFSYFRMHDDGDSVVARNIIMMEELKDQGPTFWYPRTGCGHDRFSTDMRYTYFPVAVNYFLPDWISYQVTILLMFFFCVYFTYRFAVDILKLAPPAGVFAGFTYALFFQDITTYFGYSTFPFMLWSLEKADALTGVRRITAIAGIALVFAIGSSFIYTQPVTFSLLLVWFFLVRRKFSLKFILALCFVMAIIYIIQDVPAMITALQTHFPESHKAGYTTGQTTPNFVSYALSKFFRMLVINVPAFLLSIYALFKVRRKTGEMWYVFIFAVLCTVGAGMFELVIYFLGESDLNVPAVILSSGYMVGRYTQVAYFFIGLCGAYGLDVAIRKSRESENEIVAWKMTAAQFLRFCYIGAFGFLVMFSIANKVENLGEWNKHSFYSSYHDKSSMALLGKYRRLSGELFRVSTFGETAGITAQYGLEDVGGIIVFYSQRYKSFWSKVLEPLAKRDKFVDRYFNDYGNRIYLFRPRIDNILDSDTIEFRKYYDLDLLSLANVKYIVSRVRMRDDSLELQTPDLRPWHEIKDRTQRISIRLKEVNFQGKGRDYVYENKDAFPRFFFVDKAQFFPGREELFDALGEADIPTLRTTVFLEEEFKDSFYSERLGMTPLSDTEEIRNWSVYVTHYSNDRIVLEVDPRRSAMLVASNTYSPYWKCSVDGIEVPIIPAYGTFWAVPVGFSWEPQEVVFTYEPPYKHQIKFN